LNKFDHLGANHCSQGQEVATRAIGDTVVAAAIIGGSIGVALILVS